MKVEGSYIYYTKEDAEALAYCYTKHQLTKEESKRFSKLMSV